VIESWRTFNKNRIEETYSRVFKVRNNWASKWFHSSFYDLSTVI
jgi:hypothetical protein